MHLPLFTYDVFNVAGIKFKEQHLAASSIVINCCFLGNVQDVLSDNIFLGAVMFTFQELQVDPSSLFIARPSIDACSK